MTQPDFFDGVFDNTTSGCREKYMHGRLVAYVRKTSLGCDTLAQLGMSGPWGTFPARPVESLRGECAG